MSYTVVNPNVFTAAFSGAVAGMGVSGRIISQIDPAKYAGVVAIATAFAEEFDTIWNSATTIGFLEVQSIEGACEGFWQERAPVVSDITIDPTNWESECRAIIAVIQEEVAAYIAGGFPNPPIVTGIVESVVAGDGISVDDTDPANPVVSSILSWATTADFVQPAADATVDVDVNQANWLAAGTPIRHATGGLYNVDAVLSDTSLRLRNLGVDNNATPGANVPAGTIYLAHGSPWSYTSIVAGTTTFKVPAGAHPYLFLTLRQGACGGIGGAGGGGGHTASPGGGGSGGGGSGAGGNAASQTVGPINCTPGETLTVVVGDGGPGTAGGNGGAPGSAGSPGTAGTAAQAGGVTSITGSTSGTLCATSNINATNSPFFSLGTSGTGGATGTAAGGGASKAGGTTGLRWGYASATTGVPASASGAGGNQAGTTGGSVAAGGTSGSNGMSSTTNLLPNYGAAAGGAGNGSNQGGGGAGGGGASGGQGDEVAIGGAPSQTTTTGVGGTGGAGGVATGNRNGSDGNPGTDGQGGQGGAGGGGGGGGAQGGTGGKGGAGGKGSPGLAVVRGWML